MHTGSLSKAVIPSDGVAEQSRAERRLSRADGGAVIAVMVVAIALHGRSASWLSGSSISNRDYVLADTAHHDGTPRRGSPALTDPLLCSAPRSAEAEHEHGGTLLTNNPDKSAHYCELKKHNRKCCIIWKRKKERGIKQRTEAACSTEATVQATLRI